MSKMIINDVSICLLKVLVKLDQILFLWWLRDLNPALNVVCRMDSIDSRGLKII